MIDKIIGWLTGGSNNQHRSPRDELELALAALLVEAAHSTSEGIGVEAGSSNRGGDEQERAVIARLLERHLRLSPAEAQELLEAGEREANRSIELFHFTRIINQRLSFPQRIELIEMLWEVAYADGKLDPYQDSLLRRVGGLINIPDRERGLARQRVLRRLGIDDTFESLPDHAPGAAQEKISPQ